MDISSTSRTSIRRSPTLLDTKMRKRRRKELPIASGESSAPPADGLQRMLPMLHCYNGGPHAASWATPRDNDDLSLPPVTPEILLRLGLIHIPIKDPLEHQSTYYHLGQCNHNHKHKQRHSSNTISKYEECESKIRNRKPRGNIEKLHQAGGKQQDGTTPTKHHHHHLPRTKPTLPTIRNYYSSQYHSILVLLLLALAQSIVIPNQFTTFQHVNCERSFQRHYQSAAFPPSLGRPLQSTTGQVSSSSLSSNSQRAARSDVALTVADFIAQQGGVIKDKNLTLTKLLNPIIIKRDIVVQREAKLIIESGTELLFDKQRGIIVHGTLDIQGQANDKVKLQLLRSAQSASTVNFRSQQQTNSNLNHQHLTQHQRQVRLVDGDLPSEGRVQVKLNDRWHSLCTNSKNLTAADIKVLCRQIGYQEGHWYRWFPRRNDSASATTTSSLGHPEMMSKSFHCSGAELSLQQCKRWDRIRAGGGVCDNQSNIGIRCLRKLAFAGISSEDYLQSGNVAIDHHQTRMTPAHNYWRGIEFVHSETQQEYILEGQMRQKVSKSRISHVFLSEAGLDEVGNATAAIRVYGQPPRLSDIEIKNSIYGIMIEDLEDAIKLNNIRLVNNMAAPLFVNTSWGKVTLDGLHVENNGGDGVRVVRHERTIVGSHDFCEFANLGTSQSYPVVLSHEQRFLAQGRECCQEFISQNQLTVHFPLLRSTPNNLLPESDPRRLVTVPAGVQLGRDAHLLIYDDYRDEFPFKLAIRNETRAQSIVSKSGRLKICYEPASYRTVLFTVQVVADVINEDTPADYFYGTGIAHDLVLSNSYIRRNEGRGLWLDNMRSGVRITNTTVIEHNYLSGIHVENGTGEVIIKASRISNNTGHGVLLQLAGGYFHIDNSTLSDNSLRGLSIEYDPRRELQPFNHTMHLGYTLIANNGHQGLFIGNVCRSDAFWNISMNSFIGNGEDAIVFESCRPSRETVLGFNNMTSRLNTSDGTFNEASMPHHQYIQQSRVQELLLTHNIFLANQRRAIKLAPVYFVKSFIRHNLFKEHPLAVIYISNQQVALSLEDSRWASQAPISIRVASNRFYTNRGRYVANLGLHEDATRQTLMFTKNYLEDNVITEPYVGELRPRSRVSAVVVVSSSQVKVVRNRFDNPRSSFEMGTHLEAHSKIINATANFWGFNLDAAAIYRRIFDRKNRYNLAQVEFLQYLMSPEDLEYITDLSFERERDKISSFKNGTRLGGEVKGFEELPAQTYLVHDDILIRSGGHLILRPGTVLKFLDGVGMMVLGRLEALGQASSQIHFTSASPPARQPQRGPMTTTALTTTQAPLASAWVSQQLVADDEGQQQQQQQQLNATHEYLSPKNRSSFAAERRRRLEKRQLNSYLLNPNVGSQNGIANVRLSHSTMGRLEVQIDGVWGSVCNYNFDIHDAAVACQQLGMIVNKDDWLLERYQYAVNDQPQQLSEVLSTEALMTNLQCDPTLDTDLTSCKAELSYRGDFDGLCNSEVGIRCYPPSWSGVRLGMGAETSTLEHVALQRAGMFDYATYSLRPALQVDFNKHWLNSLTIKSNSDSGLGIMFNDVIGRHFSELAVNDGKFLNNERHGIELRAARGLTIRGCMMSNNRQNGLDYNPTFSQAELDDLLSWLRTPKNSDSIVTLSFPLSNPTGEEFTTNSSKKQSQVVNFAVPSSEDSYRFFLVPRQPRPDVSESFTIATDPGHMLSIQLIAPIQRDSSEQLNMSLGLNYDSPVWDLRVNSTQLPMISPGYKFHFNYSSGARPLGSILLYVRSRYNNRDLKVLTKFIPHHLIAHKLDQTVANINSKLMNSLVLTNNTVTKNGIGLKFRHANFPHGPSSASLTSPAPNPALAFNWRYSNETTNITGNTFESNYFSAIFVSSDEHEHELDQQYEQLEPAPAEIRYNLLANKMRRNKDGLRQFSRDIRYSYNVFHWSINETTYELNKGGGIQLALPYFWRYDLNLSHSVELHNNSFLRNANFELGIEGHYAQLRLTHNKFRENRCRAKLIGVSGMEKRLDFQYNSIEQNVCNRLVDFNIQSHADKMGSVLTKFEFNSLRHNRRLISNSTYSQLAAHFRYPKLLARLHPQATDHALALRGIQAFNVTRNLFVNPELRFELVVAITMDPDERTVNAIENYWGSGRPSDIEERIFDFDDWNSFAVAEFSPFLVSDSFQAATMLADSSSSLSSSYDAVNLLEQQQHHQTNYISSQLVKPLGGRLTSSLILRTRKEPYVVESDLTVMPSTRLTIERGVTLEFMPNVGILVLGELIAAGTRDRPIQMRPLLSSQDVAPLSNYLFPAKTRPNITQAGLSDPLSHEHNYAFKHYQFTYPVDMGSVRLCKNEICNDGAHIYENNVEDPTLRREVLQGYDNSSTSSSQSGKIDGFLEIFNMTTLQWVPVCDPLFTEHTARVVCRQLGRAHMSLYKRGRRYTIEQEQVSSVRHWPRSVECEGDESNMSSCPLAATAFMNHSTACHRESNQFIYVYCRDFGLNEAAASALARSNSQARGTGATTASNEHLNNWGGIRFACPSWPSSGLNVGASRPISMFRSNQHDHNQLMQLDSIANQHQNNSRSRLQYVTIERAGLLHRRRAPAVHVFQCNVNMEHVAISNSAHHGLEVISSQSQQQNFHQLRVRNSLGMGVNFHSFTGSSSATRLVPYLPLKHLDLSSDIFGLVDVCGANKEIKIEERLLLFFRYQSRPVDCVKIISSKLAVKHLGLRMLQFDLFNSSQLTPRPDHVRVYDGNVFDRDSRLLVELGVEERHRLERPELKFYQSSDSTMTVRLHASGAGFYHGFIAELVTTPVSYNIQRDAYQNVTYSELTNNKLGALSMSSAGESTPNLILRGNRFEGNCLHLFGNFTSCVAPVHMELQNCQRLRVSNNLFKANQAGGLMIKSYSHSAVAALEASIERNVFESNQNTYALALLGPKTDPYQRVSVVGNFFTRNHARYLSNVVLSRIVANFSSNILSSNVGKHQIEVLGFDKLPLSYQSFSSNWIYNNTATFERDQSTISGNSAGQQYYMNYLVNPDNHFELSTKNWSRYDSRPLQVPRDDEIIHLVAGDGSSKDLLRKNADSIPLSIIEAKRVDLYQASINARHNWWGFNSTSAIQGRIRDRLQHEELIRVDFQPYLATNRSILSDVCAGGWQRVNGACLVYVATRMTYAEAKEFCDRERATLPLLRGNHYEFADFVRSQEAGGSANLGSGSQGALLGSLFYPQHFDPKVERIWVRSFEVSREACPALNDYRTKNYDCQDKYAFLCEKDPQVVVTLLNWHRETGGLVALLLGLITLVLFCCCSCCWAYKSRERHREKLQRKNTLYASMRSVRGAAAYSSSNSLSEFFLHRQLYNTEKSSITDLSMSTQWTQPSSNDETNLVRFDPNGSAGHKQRNRSSSQAGQLDQLDGVYKPSHNHHRSNGALAMQASQQQQVACMPNYTIKSRTPSRQTPQSALKTATPSFKEPHPRALGLLGSRTPSLSGSYSNEFDQQQQQQQQKQQQQQQLLVDDDHKDFDVGPQMQPPPQSNEPKQHRTQQGYSYSTKGPRPGGPLPSSSFPWMPNEGDYDRQPEPVEPPPELSYQYSNIRLNPDASVDNGAHSQRRSRSSSGQSGDGSQTSFQSVGRVSQANDTKSGLYTARPIILQDDLQKQRQQQAYESSASYSVPSTYEESTNSYLETYNLYGDSVNLRHNQQNHQREQTNNNSNNQDQISVVLTERSSLTDSIVTTKITESQVEYITNLPKLAMQQAAVYWSPPQEQPQPQPQPQEESIYQNGNIFLCNVSDNKQNLAQYHKRAASDVGDASNQHLRGRSGSNLMETSFDLEGPTMSPDDGRFGGSQRVLSSLQAADQQQMFPTHSLSGGPGGLFLGPSTDSKSGSRVYLETSFE